MKTRVLKIVIYWHDVKWRGEYHLRIPETLGTYVIPKATGDENVDESQSLIKRKGSP